jgi:endonuclease YncB( thermonuclease family)
MYEYTARMVENYDGDTMVVEIDVVPNREEDLGFGLRKNLHETATEKLRLYGVNSPEIKAAGPEGEQARDWLRQWMVEHCPDGDFTLNTFKTSSLNPLDKQEKYGRYLAIITAPDGHRLNDDLVTSGHAVPYMVV